MAVTSFLKAYYEQDETVIDYYLSQDADRSKFIGLDGRYTFDRMHCRVQDIRCCKWSEAVAEGTAQCGKGQRRKVLYPVYVRQSNNVILNQCPANGYHSLR